MRGPIPLGSKRKMATLFANYTSILGKVLPRPPDDSNPHNVVVHFQPDFSGTLASVNWDRESSLDPIFKDPTTARMSLKGHYAAAIMLGAILHEIVGKTPGVRTRLVFREAHGTSLYKECSMMETSSPVARDFLPFWELDAMCTILYHWRWLRTVNPLWGQSIKNYFTLPQIAHATKTAWDSEKVYAHCSQKLRRAWEVEKRGAMVLKTGATHSILGYHEKVWLVPRDDPFPHWLTTISLYMVDVRCFSVQVDFLPRLEHNENRAVELVL